MLAKSLPEQLRETSAQMVAKGLYFRLKALSFVPLKGERRKRLRKYWTAKSFKWPADRKPRPAWRYLPRLVP